MTSCKKEIEEPVNTPTAPVPNTLNGVWIEGSWRLLYTDAESVINNGNWTVSDTVYDINSTYVHWTNDDNSLLGLTTFLSNDTAWVYGEYVGDGYNNDVTTVNVTASSYLVNDTINIDGNDYLIIDYSPNGIGLDTNWRYYVESKIITPFEGCKFYLNIFKRQND